jgi:hypothetical protein
VGGAPATQYAQTRLGRIAYQAIGDGPIDVLVRMPAWFPPVDLLWEDVRLVRFLERLSSFCHHIWFDNRGLGASYPEGVEERQGVVDEVLDEAAFFMGDRITCRMRANGSTATSALVRSGWHRRPHRPTGLGAGGAG